MKHHFRLGAAVCAALLVAGVAHADAPFILPSSTSLSGSNNTVTFDAAGSDHVFSFDHRPIQLASIKVTKPDGTPATPTNTVQGRFRSVLDVRLDQEGTYKVSSGQSMISGTFKLNGEERRVGGRPGGAPPAGMGGPGGPGGPGNGQPPREGAGFQREGGPGGQGGPGGPGGPGGGMGGEGPRRQPPVAFQDIPADATDLHLNEIWSKTETFVTQGAPSTDIFKPVGKGLEFDPITHPNAVAAGETAKFRFLIDGKPAAGVKITVMAGGERYREDAGAMKLTTGADGTVSIKWPTAGMYWLGAEAEDKNPAEKKAEVRRMSYAVTLEVMTP